MLKNTLSICIIQNQISFHYITSLYALTYLKMHSKLSLSLCLNFSNDNHGQLTVRVGISISCLVHFAKYLAVAGLKRVFPKISR